MYSLSVPLVETACLLTVYEWVVLGFFISGSCVLLAVKLTTHTLPPAVSQWACNSSAQASSATQQENGNQSQMRI